MGERSIDGLARRDVVHVDGAVLGPALGQRDGDARAVGRGGIPVDRGGARLVERVWIDQHALAGRVVEAVEREKEWLLEGWLRLEREVGRATERQLVVRRRLDLEDLLEPVPDGIPERQRLEVGARPRVLRGGPLPRRLGALVL